MKPLPTYLKAVILLFGLTNLFFVLKVASSFLIPLAVAFPLSLLLMPVCRQLERWGLPRALATLVCLVGVVLLGGAGYLIVNQLVQFATELPVIAEKLSGYLEAFEQGVEDTLNIPRDSQPDYAGQAMQHALQSGAALLTNTATGALGFVTTLLLVSLYLFFMFYYRTFFRRVLFQAVKPGRHWVLSGVIGQEQGVVQQYLAGVFTVVLILTILNTAALWLIGINYAFFFGAVAGLLNILPFIGVFIGSALPVVYAFITKDSVWYPLGVMLAFNFIQVLESSVFTPHIVGGRVSLNPFAAVLALMIGGYVWGPAGMILFIPFFAVLKVICDEIPALQSLGALLGDPRRAE